MGIHTPKTVRVTSPVGGHATGTRVHDTETGHEIKRIERIAIPAFGAGDLIKVELTLAFTELVIEGVPVYEITDPGTGERKRIASVQFADGTEFRPE